MPIKRTSKLTPKVILEGTRLTFKTDIAFLLNEHLRFVGPRKYRYHSPIVSAEWGAFSPTPWGKGLINFEPEQEGRALEGYMAWMRLFEILPHSSWILDRFHISTRAYQLLTYERDYHFQWLEERLAQLDFHLVFLNRSPESFVAARAKRLQVSGNPSQYDDLDIFVQEQALMRRLVDESILPSLEIDVSDNDIESAAEQIVDWMAETGGLWAKGEEV